eukprot:COSAG02_NODE_115_length_35467_cov_292.837056_21_plen_272_part_00
MGHSRIFTLTRVCAHKLTMAALEGDVVCPPCKKQKPTHQPWCDGFYRCPICPDALGKDGRGYSRARNVPCKNPDLHLVPKRVSDTFEPGFFHWDTMEARNLDYKTDNQIKAGGTGWCWTCDCVRRDGEYVQIYKDGRNPNRVAPHSGVSGFLRIHARTAKDPPPQVVAELEVRQARTRHKDIQVIWCDGLYRCVYCVPEGQARPITSQQCKHFDDLPRINSASQHVLHFVPECKSGIVHKMMDQNFVKINRGGQSGCFRCRGDKPTCDTDL